MKQGKGRLKETGIDENKYSLTCRKDSTKEHGALQLLLRGPIGQVSALLG